MMVRPIEGIREEMGRWWELSFPQGGIKGGVKGTDAGLGGPCSRRLSSGGSTAGLCGACDTTHHHDRWFC